MKNFLPGYSQQAPFTIQVEPTEGCNLGCTFCGLQGMKHNGKTPWNFMTLETAERIASEISRVGWNSKIVFALHGEPTLNKNFLEIVRIFRKALPHNVFHIYTNGCKFNRVSDTDAYTRSIFEAGIDNIVVDCYSDNGDWRFVEKLSEEMKTLIVRYGKGISLHTSSRNEKRILLLPPIQVDQNNKSTRRLANHSGAAFPLDNSFNNKRCTMPFRELCFRWDGSVALCCDDFRGRYPIANIHDLKIEEIWNHPRFQAARIMLYSYSREFAPCKGCTNVSMRVGFLPDSSGQDSMPKPTKEVIAYAEFVTRLNEPLADFIVKRDWEK